MNFRIQSLWSGQWRLKRQLYGLRDAPKSWQAHSSQIVISKGMVQMKSDSRKFLKKDQVGHVQLAVMAYVDDLVTPGSAQMVREFISMIQEEFTLKHVNFLTSENLVDFLGRTSKRVQNGNSTMEFSQKFMDDLLRLFEVTGKVAITGLKLQALREDQRAQCDKVIHQKFRSVFGNFFGWLSSGMTSTTRARSFQDHSSTRKIRTSNSHSLDALSSMSIRQETSSSSWSLSFQSGIRKASSRFSLSAVEIQSGQVVKNHGS